MYVRVKTVDGSREVTFSVSKLTSIEDLKAMVEKEMSVETELQRLFFGGKQLENGQTLFDYNINLNDVIVLLVTVKLVTGTSEERTLDKEREEELVEGESRFYKSGDRIDCVDLSYGAWFEAIVYKICKRGKDLVYKVKWEMEEDCDPFEIEEKYIRPRAKKLIDFDDLELGQQVMINYNIESPKEIGQWYDFTISKIHKTKKLEQLTGTLYVGRDRLPLECKVSPRGEIFAIEEPIPILDRTPQEMERMQQIGERRKVAPKCSSCRDKQHRKCKECGCKVCGGKDNENELLACDECNYYYHLRCLDPPLTSVPDEEYWYCPECKNDENEIVKVGDKLKPSKKKSKGGGGVGDKPKKDWGKGFACAAKTKDCTIVPIHHKGPIPGVEVGTCWLYRIGVAESGVHRPPVAGIHGRESECAYSLVLSGGYEDDVDNGDEFLYTGSGGRDLSGNKRTARQSCHQEFTLNNKALALNCNAELNSKEGAEAKGDDWKKGIPVRVVRNFKLSKHSKYAPTVGNRYDGIYKVVKYYPQMGKSGFRVWRYVLRRDDPAPAPWTPEGQQRIADLGLEISYPDGYLEAKKNKKEETNKKRKKTLGENNGPCTSDEDAPPEKKPRRQGYELDEDLADLIKADQRNVKLWKECRRSLPEGKARFLQLVSERFMCVCCQEVVVKPVTTPCLHNICIQCLKRSFAAGIYSCSSCRHPLEKDGKIQVNESLSTALQLLYPGYEAR